MVLCIVWKRAGLKLNPGIWHRADGSAYESGTVLEFETAVAVSRKHKGTPDVYLFRKTADVLLHADRASEELEQYQLLQAVWKRWTESEEGYNTAGFQNFTEVDDFEQKVEACLRQWLERRGILATTVWDRSVRGSPFCGLAAFDAERAQVFFGRAGAVARATAKLRKSPFLLLIGASGSGKSSLMRAGLLPRIVLPGAIAEVDAWRTAIMSPAAAPFSELAESLFVEEALGAELRAGDFNTPQALTELLAAGAQPALAPIRSALARAANARKDMLHYESVRPVKLLLAIDQLERLFVEAETGKVEAFAALLQNLVEAELASVIVALRSDAYGRFQAVAPLLAILEKQGATLDVLPPSSAELEDIVVRPVAACHPPLVYEADAGGRSLAEVLVAESKGGDCLPLLQMTLQRLYDAESRRGDGLLRFADYPGMAAAVTRAAEEAVAGLDAAALAALPKLITAFVRDVSVGPDGRFEGLTIVPVSRAAFEHGDPGRKALIDEFVKARLLTVEGENGAGRVRPVHEALLRVVPQAVAVIKENAALIRVRHSLETMVAEWAQAAPDAKEDHLPTSPALVAGAAQLLDRLGDDLSDEMRSFISDTLAADTRRREREQRRARRILTATAAGLVIALSLAALAGWQWQVANTQRERAQTALSAATNTAETLVFDLAREFKARPGMPLDLVNSILERVQSLERQLAATGSTPDLRRLEAVSLNELSDAFLSQGNLPAALGAAERSLAILQVMVKEFPQLPLLQRDLAIAFNQLGDVRRAEQNFPQSLDAYEHALAIVQTFAALSPDDVRWQRDLWLSYNKIADVQAITGALDAALSTYRKGLAGMQGLVERHPENATLRADLAFAYNRIAIVVGAQGDSEQALDLYRKALAIHEELAAAEPGNTERRRDVFVSWKRVGGALAASGRRQEAIAAFRKAIDTMEQLAPTDLGNAHWQHDLVGVYEQTGQLLVQEGLRDQALQLQEKLLASRQRMVAITPSNLQWQYDLAAAYLKLGGMLISAQQRNPAIDYYRRSIPVFEFLISADPSKPGRNRDLSIAHLKIGEALAGAQQWPQARAAYEQCLAIRERLAPLDPRNMLWQRDLAFILERIASSFSQEKDYAAALENYKRALAVRQAVRTAEPGNIPYHRELALSQTLLAETLYALGRKAEGQASLVAAFAIVESYAAKEPDNGQLQMDLVTGLYRLAYFIAEDSEKRHERALAIVQTLAAKGKLSAPDKAWADALEKWLAGKPA